jgi:hypothetical protein
VAAYWSAPGSSVAVEASRDGQRDLLFSDTIGGLERCKEFRALEGLMNTAVH